MGVKVVVVVEQWVETQIDDRRNDIRVVQTVLVVLESVDAQIGVDLASDVSRLSAFFVRIVQ